MFKIFVVSIKIKSQAKYFLFYFFINSNIKNDKKGNKLSWLNGAFYIDDMILEEAKEKIQILQEKILKY